MDGDLNLSGVTSRLMREAREILSKSKPCAISTIGMCTPRCLEFNKCRKNPYKQEEKKKK